MDENRFAVAAFGAIIAAVVGYVIYRFIAAFTIAIFLYYSTRRFYVWLGKLRIPKQIRAALTLSFMAVPLLLLLSYTIILLAVETRQFIEDYPVIEAAPEGIAWIEGLGDLPELTIEGLVGAYRAGELDVFISFAIEHAGFVTSLLAVFLLNMLIIVILTYYLLIESSKFYEWKLRYDEDSGIRQFVDAADRELEAVLFGNLLNVIIISIVAIVVFMGYNTFVPEAARVPYPVLAGALTGIASLIPVVGMKIVYVPVAIAAAVPIVDGGDLSLLVYIAGFLVLTVVLVDTIPDLLLRPYLSGEETHVGLLMLAYIFGPIIFGFYGLFLAPILLVLTLTFADTALPHLLGADTDEGLPDSQRRLEEFR